MDRFEYANYRTGYIPILYIIDHKDDCPVHNHDYTELVVVLSGNGIHLTETIKYPIQTGDIFVIHKNQYHGYENVNNMKVATLMFIYDDFFKDNNDLTSSTKFRILFNFTRQAPQKSKFPYRMFLESEKYYIVENFINKLEHEQEQKLLGYKSVMKAVFWELIVFLVRDYTIEYNEQHEFIHNLAKTFNFIEKNYKTNIAIKSLARKANMSYRNFQREFKKITHKSPSQYIIEKRLDNASVMLKDNNKNISNIALEVGFSNSNYFARQFKMKFKLSPSEYRKINLLNC